MDTIINTRGFDFLHDNLQAFQKHLVSTFPESIYKDIGNREVARQEEDNIKNINTTSQQMTQQNGIQQITTQNGT